MIGVFVALVLTLLLLVGWLLSQLEIDQDMDRALALPVHAIAFAVAAFVAIIAGTALAPRRLAMLAVGILSINLVLPFVALTVQDVLHGGRAGYGGSEVGEILGVGAGAIVAYRILGGRRDRLAPPAPWRGAHFAIYAASALLLLLPLPSVTVPRWRVQFVDAAAQPLAGLAIKQDWIDSVEGQDIGHEEVATTDAQGWVAFPERALWAPIALRVWGPVRNVLSAFLHASSGRYASLAPLCPLRAVDPELTYYLGQALAEQVSLAPAEGPEGSVNADCVRLVEQAKRARVPR